VVVGYVSRPGDLVLRGDVPWRAERDEAMQAEAGCGLVRVVGGRGKWAK
jgi:hypothetical protein